MSIDFSGWWKITADKELMDSLRDNAAFLAVLRLARGVNALRFCHVAVADRPDSPSSPSYHRQINNAFFFTCGLLFEGMEVARQSSMALKDYSEFREKLVPLFRNRELDALLTSDLVNFRNKIVFHFDPDVISESLSRLDLPEYQFARCEGRESRGMYFSLADEVVLNFALDEQEDQETGEKARLERLATLATQFQLEFTDAADGVIGQVLLDLGWRAEQLEEPSSDVEGGVVGDEGGSGPPE